MQKKEERYAVNWHGVAIVSHGFCDKDAKNDVFYANQAGRFHFFVDVSVALCVSSIIGF